MKFVTKEIAEQMQSYYNETKSCNKVAEKFNFNRCTVLKYIITKVPEGRKKTSVKNVVEWRKRTKIKAVEYKGGKCEKCGYDKCIEALQFHHINPSLKDFSISGKSCSWDKIKTEIDKCIMICANCHAEIHFFKKEINI